MDDKTGKDGRKWQRQGFLGGRGKQIPGDVLDPWVAFLSPPMCVHLGATTILTLRSKRETIILPLLFLRMLFGPSPHTGMPVDVSAEKHT